MWEGYAISNAKWTGVRLRVSTVFYCGEYGSGYGSYTNFLNTISDQYPVPDPPVCLSEPGIRTVKSL